MNFIYIIWMYQKNLSKMFFSRKITFIEKKRVSTASDAEKVIPLQHKRNE